MDPGVFIFLVMLLSALPLYVLTYLIGVKKRVGLVAGYDPSRVADPDGLANWVGLILFLIGIAIVLMGLGVCLFIEKTLTLILIGVALITTLVIALIVGIQKYVA